ncbi:superoxide dismutase [candidate division WOR-3 bacterium]|nr:superoxide dismutase [candidate division WOR-3 bacterium]
MKVLAIARVDPQTTPEKIMPYLEAEVKHAWNLYKEGTLREMYNWQNRRLGVVFVLECISTEEARKILDELPFVREKLIDFEIIPLEPFSYFETLYRDYKKPQQL